MLPEFNSINQLILQLNSHAGTYNNLVKWNHDTPVGRGSPASPAVRRLQTSQAPEGRAAAIRQHKVRTFTRPDKNREDKQQDASDSRPR